MGRRARRTSMRDSAREDAERTHSGRSNHLKTAEGVQWFKPKGERTYLLDLVPFEVKNPLLVRPREVGDLWYKVDLKLHSNVGVDEQRVCCPKMWGEPCPMCEEFAEKTSGGRLPKDEYKQLAGQLQAKDRNIFNVQLDRELYLWDVSFHNFQRLFVQNLKASEPEDDWYGFADLEGGFSLKVSFAEMSFEGGRAFARASIINFVRRKKDLGEEILTRVAQLDELPVQMGYEELQNLYLGIRQEESSPKPETSGNTERAPRRSAEAPPEAPPEPEPPEPEPDNPPETETEPEVNDTTDPEGRPLTELAISFAPDVRCKACKGHGKSTSGRQCRACHGKGVSEKEVRKAKNEEPPPTDEKPPEEHKEMPERQRQRKSQNEDNPCPFGHHWGEDFDDPVKCAKCPETTWNGCGDAHDDLEATGGSEG